MADLNLHLELAMMDRIIRSPKLVSEDRDDLFRGKINGFDAAVQVFASIANISSHYNILLRLQATPHNNILTFLGADIDVNGRYQFALILDERHKKKRRTLRDESKSKKSKRPQMSSSQLVAAVMKLCLKKKEEEASKLMEEMEVNDDDRSVKKSILTLKDSCDFCCENPKSPHHLVAKARFTSLTLLQEQHVVPDHCYILSPREHKLPTRSLDDLVWDEIRSFKQSLVLMFAKLNKTVVFLETFMGLAD